MKNLRKKSFIRVPVLSIEVASRQSSSVIAKRNPIRIQHWHYLKHHIFSHNESFLCVSAEPLDEPFHHMRAVGLSGMRSARNDNASLVYAILIVHICVVVLQSLVDDDQRHL